MKAVRLRVIAAMLPVVGIFVSRVQSFDFISSHALGMGGTTLLSQTPPSMLVNAPGGGTADRSLKFEFGYNRKYDLADLDQLFAAAAIRRGRLTLAVGVSQFGKTSLYSEKTIKGMLSYQRGAIVLGMTGSMLQAELGNNYGRFDAQTIGAGAGVRTKHVLASVTADNLTRPKLFESAVPFARSSEFNLELLTDRKMSIMARASAVEHEPTRFGLGQRIPLTGGSAISWGITTRPIEYGAGVDIGTRWMMFSYAASIHPVLGFSQTITLSLGTKGPRSTSGKTPEDNFD